MLLLAKGNFRARLAEVEADVARAQRLRHRSFLARRGRSTEAQADVDDFDGVCQHVLVEAQASGELVCCYRVLRLPTAARINETYAAQSYDLRALAAYPGPVLEMGRFCLHPDWHDPDILRLAWGAMTRLVDAAGVRLMFGCSSFEGSDPGLHGAAFALLRAHLGPARWMPGQKAKEIHRFCEDAAVGDDGKTGTHGMPALLRTYMVMGGWVSDHAVIDRDLDTLHVFTAVEIDRIPPARARMLRAIAE